MYRQLLACVALTLVPAAAQTPTLIHSTYFGGNSIDVVTSVATDQAGNLYVCGFTYSSDLPVTPGAFQSQQAGVPGTVFSIFQAPPEPDAFVAKFDPTGHVVYATYLGGAVYDVAAAIAVDAEGNAVVVGQTNSANFPVTPGALQAKLPSATGTSMFVTKLNASGSGLIFSTYFGDNGSDMANSVALDAAGAIYVGGTNASGAVVAKLSANGSTLLYSMTLGGAGDSVNGLTVDPAGNAYLAGVTYSSQFPVTAGAFQPTAGAAASAFVAKVNPAGSALLASTYLGGSDVTQATGRIVVDAEGDVTVSGLTVAADFPVTAGAFQPNFGGVEDAFVAKLKPDLSGLIFGTYLGGTGEDFGSSVAQDSQGNLWVIGTTASTDFPITTGPLSRAFAGSPCLFTGATPFGMPPIVGSCFDIFVTEFSGDGKLLYSSTLSGSNRDFADDIAVLGSGTVAAVGSTRSNDFPVTLDAFQQYRNPTACMTEGSPSSMDTEPCEDAFLSLLGAPVSAPAPFSILNHASFLATPIAANEIVALFGENIGPATPAGAIVNPPGFIATENAGMQLLFNNVPAPLLFMNRNEIDAIVPLAGVGDPQVTVAIERGGSVIATATVMTAAVSPGVLGQGPGIMGQAAVINQDGSVNSPSHPAPAGSIASLYVVGIDTGGAAGQIATSAVPLAEVPKVIVGPMVATVTYAGTSPTLVSAVTQINFVVPPVSGSAVPIYIISSGFGSQYGAVISVQ